VHLDAVPPWEGIIVLDPREDIVLRVGHRLRVKLEWTGAEGGYIAEVSVLGPPESGPAGRSAPAV